MAMWESEKFNDGINANNIDDNFDGILVTHDLQDCLDDSLDLSSFEKVYEQSSTIKFDNEKYTNEETSYITKLVDDSTG